MTYKAILNDQCVGKYWRFLKPCEPGDGMPAAEYRIECIGNNWYPVRIVQTGKILNYKKSASGAIRVRIEFLKDNKSSTFDRAWALVEK